MKKKNPLASFIGFVAAALIFATAPVVPAQAAMIGTAQQAEQGQRAEQIDKVEKFMARDDVKQQMVALGVSPEMAQTRVASLTDSELQDLSQRIDNAPAGGDGVFVLLGVVFLVLIILELCGVTHIFSHF